MKTDTFIQNSLGKDISENLGYTLCQWQSFIKGITTDPHTVSIFIKLNTPKSFFFLFLCLLQFDAGAKWEQQKTS